MSEIQPVSGPLLVAYYRVSTKAQGLSGLGLEAQRAAVAQHVHRTGSSLHAEYTEIETGKGADALGSVLKPLARDEAE
jgi:DNA invertase Pin-like site-specific DNA recombinase